MGEAIAALVVGSMLIDVAEAAGAFKRALLEEQDFRVTHGITPFVGDHAGDDRAGGEWKAEVFGIEAGTDDDAGRKAFMLMEGLHCVASATRHEPVLARGQIREEEAASG